MTVEPGFGGQNFMPEMLTKVREIRKRLRPDQRLEIDGGIHAQTIALAREAGVDWFVVGSGIECLSHDVPPWPLNVLDFPGFPVAVGQSRAAVYQGGQIPA